MNNIIKLGIGEIPLDKLCMWLDDRSYSKDLTIQHIRDIYNQDVDNEVNKLVNNYKAHFDYSKDVFKDFDEKHPHKIEDDSTREYFNKYGRNRYLRFFNCYKENDNIIYDEILATGIRADHVHHILPLDYGGNSNPKNLIGVIKPLHILLHSNPLQHIEKYCHMAVDYLKYLCIWQSEDMFEKYNINANQDTNVLIEFFTVALKNEMKLFYDKLLQDFNTNKIN